MNILDKLIKRFEQNIRKLHNYNCCQACPVTINWEYTGNNYGDPIVTFEIYVNGVLVIQRNLTEPGTITDSGSFIVHEGDLIHFVAGNSGGSFHIVNATITGSSSGVIWTDSGLNYNLEHDLTIPAGCPENYTLSAIQ